MATAPKPKPRTTRKRAITMSEIDSSVVRELATHAADINHMKEDMDRILTEMAQMQMCLNKISSTLSEAKGGWRMLMMLGGLAGVVGSLLTHFVSALPWGK